MTYLYLYLLSQNFTQPLSIVFIAFIIVLFMWGMLILISEFEIQSRPPKWVYVITIVFGVLLTIFPNKQTLTYWGAFYVGKEVAQSEPVQKLYKILNEKLDNELKELTEAKSIK